jgi:enamine deaminase RidA (YjgF/YER057c/UK114 family)
MTVDVPARLASLGLELPALRSRSGNYIGYQQAGDFLFLAGQGADGWVGRVGADMSLEQAKLAARDCMLNLLAQANDALAGDWSGWVKPVKMLGFVACTESFTACPTVIDGASDLLIEVFGTDGNHARSAVGVQALPLGFAVEIELIVQLQNRSR